jgi:hypothetical protein
VRLHEAAAHLEIRQVLYRYCRGVDRGEPETIASVYHPDAYDRHGSWEGPGKDFAAYLVPAMDAVPAVGQHHITNVLIELSGEAADVESYFIAFHPQAGPGGPQHALVCGRYLDRFERRNGTWLIVDRQVVVDLSRLMDATESWPGAVSFPAGGHREADLSARRRPPEN